MRTRFAFVSLSILRIRDCLFHIFDFFGMDSIAKKEGAEPKAEGGNTIVIQVCDSVCSFFSKFHSSRKAELFTFV